MPATATATVRDALRHAAQRTDLLAPTPEQPHTLVVAFSGGQDSAALLHALAVYSARRPGLRLLAAHVDHAVRPDSAADAERALALAESIGVSAVARRVDVAAYRAMEKRWSVQQAARAARYQALAAIVAEHRADALAVAHTADDQAETVLLHLLRGSGLAGLRGMALAESLDPTRLGPPLPELTTWGATLPHDLRVVRPLLMVPRATTRAYCQERHLAVVEDPTNQKRIYARNRLRLDLLPLLEQYNPRIRTTLARLADLAGEDLAALDALAAARFQALAEPVPHGVRISLSAWRAEPRALQRRVLRAAVELLAGTLQDLTAAPVEDALDLLASSSRPAEYHLPHGVSLHLTAHAFTLAVPGGHATRLPVAEPAASKGVSVDVNTYPEPAAHPAAEVVPVGGGGAKLPRKEKSSPSCGKGQGVGQAIPATRPAYGQSPHGQSALITGSPSEASV